MELKFQGLHKSLDAPPTEGPLNDLVVLSGPNGSGKSNLLEVIQLGRITVDDIPAPNHPPLIKLFRLAELVAVSGGGQAAVNFKNRWAQSGIKSIQCRSSSTLDTYLPIR